MEVMEASGKVINELKQRIIAPEISISLFPCRTLRIRFLFTERNHRGKLRIFRTDLQPVHVLDALRIIKIRIELPGYQHFHNIHQRTFILRQFQIDKRGSNIIRALIEPFGEWDHIAVIIIRYRIQQFPVVLCVGISIVFSVIIAQLGNAITVPVKMFQRDPVHDDAGTIRISFPFHFCISLGGRYPVTVPEFAFLAVDGLIHCPVNTQANIFLSSPSFRFPLLVEIQCPFECKERFPFFR